MKITEHQETNHLLNGGADCTSIYKILAKLRINFVPLDKHHPVAFYKDNDTIPGENSSRLTLIY